MKPTLNKEDIKIIKRLIRYEFKSALVRTIEVEKAARPGEDLPREGKVHEKVKTNVLDWFVSYLPYIEGALRGIQKDTNKTNNAVRENLIPLITDDMLEGLIAIKNILLNHEDNLLTIGEFSKKTKLLMSDDKMKRIPL
ncbi:MAG: hypothetical protein ACXADW_20355 [Candidatus Hodarchaeales archaeon]|jgi:hypothetical protein